MLRISVLACFLVACGHSDDGGGTTGSSSGTTAVAESSSASATMSSTTVYPPGCDVPPEDCQTCWSCARYNACKTTYDTCASNFECAGSLACIDNQCPGDGIQQPCVDHCCLNCAEHLMCNVVDAVITCVEEQCADLCGPVTCTTG